MTSSSGQALASIAKLVVFCPFIDMIVLKGNLFTSNFKCTENLQWQYKVLTLATAHKTRQCALPRMRTVFQGTSTRPSRKEIIVVPHRDPIFRPTATFTSCPNFRETSFPILIQVSFPGTVIDTFPHFHKLGGCKVHR